MNLSSEQKQAELQRLRDILLATIGYKLAAQRGSIVFDQVDRIEEHWEQERLQVENDYAEGQLDNLQQKLTQYTEGIQNRADLNFEGYIKEKTGYDIDIFEDLRNRVDAILTRNEIQNQQESRDVGAMLHYYHQTSADIALIDGLRKLSYDYGIAIREKEISYTETVSTTDQDGVTHVRIKHVTGPRPQHFVEEEAISPDGKRRLRVVQWSDGKHATTAVSIIFPTASGGIYAANGIHPGVKASWKNNSTIVIELPKDIPGHTQHKEARSFEDVIAIEYIEH